MLRIQPQYEFTSHSQSSDSPLQVPGMPPMPPMPMPPMPPGMGMLQAMSMMPGGPPPPGIHMGMEPPGLPPPGMSQDDQLKMVQQRAAMVLQQEERAKQQVRAAGQLCGSPVAFSKDSKTKI